MASTPSNFFPIPGFVASPAWPNAWRAGKDKVATIALDEFDSLIVTKEDETAFNLVSNGVGKDLKRLTPGHGYPLHDGKTYSMHFEATCSGDLMAQLAIHEYDSSGERLTRSLLQNGRRGIFVASEESTHLIISLRAVGAGELRLNRIEVSENTTLPTGTPGLHEFALRPLPSKTSSREFAALRKFLLSSRFLKEGIAEVVADVTAKDMENARHESANLAEQYEHIISELDELKRSLNKLQKRTVSDNLQDELRGLGSVRFNTDVSPPAPHRHRSA